jgi:hypothetical protein
MRPYYYYYIVTGTLLILLIMDFAVAAPVLVQEKRQAGVGVVRMPEDARTMLKRSDEWKLWLDILKSDLPKESSSSPPSGPADGLTGVKQPLPFVPKETSPVSNPDDELWVNLSGHPESYFFEHPSSSSLPSGHTDGLTDVGQPLPSGPKETLPFSTPYIKLKDLWVELFDHPESSSSEHPSSRSLPSGHSAGTLMG